MTRAPATTETLARKIVEMVNRLRSLELDKPPGVAETLDWVETMSVLGVDDPDKESIRDTLGAVVKDHDDMQTVLGALDRIAVDG